MTNTPMRKWISYYGIEWVTDISSVTANYSRYSNDRTKLEIILGDTSNITECLYFVIG